MSNQPTISAETIAAMNAWQDAHVVPYQDMKDGRLVALDLDDYDASALILAMAACEPVRGLVEAAIGVLSDVQFVEDRGQYPVSEFKLKAVEAALAPFAKGGA
jgi:uncharacterized membrane protein